MSPPGSLLTSGSQAQQLLNMAQHKHGAAFPYTFKAGLGACEGYLGIFPCHMGLEAGALHSASAFQKVCVLAFRLILETGRKKLPCLTLTPSSLSEQMKDDRVQLPLGNAFQGSHRPRSDSSSHDKPTAL